MKKKFTISRGNDFRYNQISKLSIKIYSHQRYINVQYYLKLRIPMCHRLFFRRISQNHNFIPRYCNDLNIPFVFACRQCIHHVILYKYMNSYIQIIKYLLVLI